MGIINMLQQAYTRIFGSPEVYQSDIPHLDDLEQRVNLTEAESKGVEDTLYSKFPTDAMSRLKPKTYKFKAGITGDDFEDVLDRVYDSSEQDLETALMTSAVKKANDKSGLFAIRKGQGKTMVSVSIEPCEKERQIPAYMDMGNKPNKRIEPVTVTTEIYRGDETLGTWIYTNATLDKVVKEGREKLIFNPGDLMTRTEAREKSNPLHRVIDEKAIYTVKQYNEAYEPKETNTPDTPVVIGSAPLSTPITQKPMKFAPSETSGQPTS